MTDAQYEQTHRFGRQLYESGLLSRFSPRYPIVDGEAQASVAEQVRIEEVG